MVMLSSSPNVHSNQVATASASPDFSLASAVLEGFAAGVLILTQDGTCLHHNHKGRAFCRLLSDAPIPESGAHALMIPPSLRAMAHHLMEGRNLFPNHPLVLSQDLAGAGHAIRVRVQWLDWPATEASYLVVLLDDATQIAQAAAHLEALRYNLTPREREVWMLRQANHSYEDIAQALHISVNTVKRHLKSIYAKRKQVLDEAEAEGVLNGD